MLHLENFFEKSFALLLTTPSNRLVFQKWLQYEENCERIRLW